MTIKDISIQYNISMETLRYYEKVGLFDDVHKTNDIREYDDHDIERLSLILSLKNMGMSIESISRYVELDRLGKQSLEQRKQMLKLERIRLLDDIHHQQKQLDLLDYFLYQCKEEAHEKE